MDIISFNRYNGWYSNPGHLDMVTQHVVEEADSWHKRHDKPVLMSEYGADTLEGYHSVRLICMEINFLLIVNCISVA